MRGQWIGQFNGNTSGTIIVNVDELQDSYQGIAYLLQDDINIPHSAVSFKTADKANNFQFTTTSLVPINNWLLPDTWENVKAQYPKGNMSNSASVTGRWSSKRLSLSWTTDIGIVGTCKLKCSESEQKSKIKAKKINWEKFKKNYFQTRR